MDTQGDGGRRKFARLRAWNLRQEEWTYRHPWRTAAVMATVWCAPWVWNALRSEHGVGLPFVGGLWVLWFVMSGALTKRRANRPQWEPLGTLPTDLTLRGDSGPVMGEDGRRWRTGSP